MTIPCIAASRFTDTLYCLSMDFDVHFLVNPIAHVNLMRSAEMPQGELIELQFLHINCGVQR